MLPLAYISQGDMISTPPMPWARICSSCQVRPSFVTAFPGHHQRVCGR